MSSYEQVDEPAEVEQHAEEPVQATPVVAKSKRKVSGAWMHFTKIQLPDGTYQDANCNHCGKRFKWSNSTGTSTMLSHIQNNSCSNYKYVPPTLFKSPIIEFQFDQMSSRRDFAIACAKHNYPFNMAEHEYFELFLKGLNPAFSLASRNTIRADVIVVYEEFKQHIYDLLDGLKCKVALTTDIWYDEHSNKSYSCLTVHFIDESWVLHKKIVAFKRLTYPHDGAKIFSFMKSGMLDWNLDKKVSCIVVDDATNNTNMMYRMQNWLSRDSVLPLSGALLHVRCSAHVLNLIVKAGLVKIQPLIDNIRLTVRYLERTPSALEKFATTKQHCGLEKAREIAMDVSTRWNSTFKLLDTSLPLRRALNRLSEIDQSYFNCPAPLEWNRAEIVFDCLKIFYEATKHFSGSKYPTSNVFFPDMCNIYLKLIEWNGSEVLFLRDLSKTMMEKFDKYWEDSNLVLATAVVFDPRLKMHVVDFYYGEIYKDGAAPHVKRVRDSLDALFAAYGGSSGSSTSTPNVVVGPSNLRSFSAWYGASHPSLNNKSELELYLEERICTPSEDFDVLYWWKSEGARFPVLRKIARDILAIPATTVASESAFSLGGRVIDESRSNLAEDAIEALICLNDWVPPIKCERQYQFVMPSEEVLQNVMSEVSSSRVVGSSSGSEVPHGAQH